VQPLKGVRFDAQIIVEHRYRGCSPCRGFVDPALPPALNIEGIEIVNHYAAAR